MRPRNDYIIIRRVKPEGTSASGLLVLPDVAGREKRLAAEIVAIGPGAFTQTGGRCTEQMSDLKVGMKVMVSKYGGVGLEDKPQDEQDLFAVREGEILIILDESPKGRKEK